MLSASIPCLMPEQEHPRKNQHPSPALCLGRSIRIRTPMSLSAEEGERNVRRSVDHVSAASSENEKLGADSPQSQ